MSFDVAFQFDDLYTKKQVVHTECEFTVSPSPLPQSLFLFNLALKPGPLTADCQF